MRASGSSSAMETSVLESTTQRRTLGRRSKIRPELECRSQAQECSGSRSSFKGDDARMIFFNEKVDLSLDRCSSLTFLSRAAAHLSDLAARRVTIPIACQVGSLVGRVS